MFISKGEIIDQKCFVRKYVYEKGSSHAAGTWLLSDVTPNLTRLLDTLDVLELMEEIESWLPLRSRDNGMPRPYFGTEPLRGLGVTPREAAMALLVIPHLVTLWTGAKSPYKGLQLKYLKHSNICKFATTCQLSVR